MKEVRYSTDRRSEAYIAVNNCGEQILDKRDYDTVRENGRLDFGLQFAAEGCIHFEDNGVYDTAEAGCFILHFPGVRQHYFFKKEEKTHLLWVHFSGKIGEMLRDIQSDRTVKVKVDDPKTFRRVLENMIRAYNRREPYYQTTCEGYLQVLLALVMQSATVAKNNATVRHDELTRVLAEMNDKFNEPIDLDAYAELCFVSKSRFLHMFKAYTGVSPYHFQLQIRVERAAEMLTYTSLSVRECAEAVGFKDCSYFCRVFKKFTGHNPRYYRK